jgi:hypothetical protein
VWYGATAGAGAATSPAPVEGTGVSDSAGAGAATSPLTVGAGAATSPGDNTGSGSSAASAPLALVLPAQADEIPSVLLLNFSWNGSTLPMAVAAESAWFHGAFPEARTVISFGQGAATSPLKLRAAESFVPALPELTGSPACSSVVLKTFGAAAASEGASTVLPSMGDCGSAATCEAQASAIADLWAWAAGQGAATSPRRPQFQSAYGMSEDVFTRLGDALGAWARFAALPESSPSAEYDRLLIASGLDLVASGAGADAPAGDGTHLSCGPDLDGEALSSALVADPAVLQQACVPEL